MEPCVVYGCAFAKVLCFPQFYFITFLSQTFHQQIRFEAKSEFRGHIAGSPLEWNLDNDEPGDHISAQISSHMFRSVLRSVHKCSDDFTDAEIRSDAQITVCGCVCVCGCGCVLCVLCVWVGVCLCVWVCVCCVCLQMLKSMQILRSMHRSVLRSIPRCSDRCLGQFTDAQMISQTFRSVQMLRSMCVWVCVVCVCGCV
jgi:hypothetical protein